MYLRTAILVVMASIPGQAAPKILVHGHRGARAVMPENTIAAFEYAISAGADVLELDLAVTRDNVLVVSHDPIVNDKICRGPRQGAVIREMTAAELRQWDCGAVPNPAFPKQKAVPGRIPTFDEVLALAPRGSFEFNVEMKSFPDRPRLTPPPDEFARLVLEAIRRRKLESRVIVQSFDFRTLHAMKKSEPGIRLAALIEPGFKNLLSRSLVAAAKEAGTSIVSPNYLLVTASRVKEAHAAGLQVIPWTVNDPETWESMIRAGVDAIISDDPAGLIEYLRKTGRR